MFLTVTTNTSLDRIMFIEEFSPEKTMRAGHYLDSIGGKGLDVSSVQRTLIPSAWHSSAGITGNFSPTWSSEPVFPLN
jgi:fructose-1-phosphate kinase PfkB-like protein